MREQLNRSLQIETDRDPMSVVVARTVTFVRTHISDLLPPSYVI